MPVLTWSSQNVKIRGIADLLGIPYNTVYAFDLPAGYTCPAADICHSRADRITGKITDFDTTKFRCYAASSESAFPQARASRWRNYDAIKDLSTDEIVALILSELPNKARIIRIHSSGDYFHKKYFMAWVQVAVARPDITFFGYTKILPYVKFARPDNFHLVYSIGGKLDDKYTPDVPCSRVVMTFDEAEKFGLPVACHVHHSDDYNFIVQRKSFALVIHGTQSPKTNKLIKSLQKKV